MSSKPKLKDTTTTAVPPARATGGPRGPIGPKPGVYRPCSRCRVKKTKCDRLRPACSSCSKGGADAVCIYDNDEPGSSGSDAGSNNSSVLVASTKTDLSVPQASSTKTAIAPDGPSKAKYGAGSASSGVAVLTSTTARPTNGHGTRSSNGGHGGKVDSPVAVKRSIHAESPHKQPKLAGSGSSEAIKPSPLRSSITTIRIPAIKSPTEASAITTTSNSKDSDSNHDENVDIESVDVVEDKDFSGLSITDAATDGAPSEANQEDATDTQDAPPKRVSASTAARQKRLAKTATISNGSGAGGAAGNQSRIMVDLPAAKPLPPFVIDKNQKARKWGRSSTVVQTLGGEISIPLWISGQEMLLNEPRPYFMQRTYPMPTIPSTLSPTTNTNANSTSATATNLARMAVFNQMDYSSNSNSYFGGPGGYDTPERGTTPESGESSPAAAPSSPLMMKMTKKMKRGPRKQQHQHRHQQRSQDPLGEDSDTAEITTKAGATAATIGVKRKRGPYPTSSSSTSGRAAASAAAAAAAGTVAVAGYDDGAESSARSTPAPTANSTPRPRPIPTRPRMYPCSFEGCTKSFMDKFHLKRHETRHVTQAIECGIDGCTKSYDSISTMRRHQSMIHKERKEEMAAAAAATAAANAGASSVGEGFSVGPTDEDGADISMATFEEEEGEEEDEVRSEDSGSSPTQSSVTYTAISSPMRD